MSYEVNCPYCKEGAEFITSKEFYGRDYKTNIYICRDCDARVGTHRNSKRPLGTMANAELRELRRVCHSLIDPFWQYGKYSRKTVYIRMAKAMGLTSAEAHIGMFNEEQCRELIGYFQKGK